MNRRQTIPKELRYTIKDFNAQFPNDDACLAHLMEQRFPGNVVYCEKCKKERKHYKLAGRPVYSCDHCRSQISPMAGTIFEHSSTSLRLWYYAMYLMASTRCGISAKQIQRELGVTYKTAWRMFRQIRSLLSEDLKLEGSLVEMDETYVGGHIRGVKNKTKNKTCVVGIAERKGRVVALAAPDKSGRTILKYARERILPKSTVFTDEATTYDGLTHMDMGYTHRRIHHSSKVYVQGDVHTNTIEGFWSLVKRGLGGVYHSVSQKYLQNYLDEYSFRYNRREQGNLIFNAFLKRVSEKADSQPVVKGHENPVVQ